MKAQSTKYDKEMQGIFYKTTVVIGAIDMHCHKNSEPNTKTIIGCLNVTCLSMAHYGKLKIRRKKIKSASWWEFIFLAKILNLLRLVVINSNQIVLTFFLLEDICVMLPSFLKSSDTLANEMHFISG